MSGCLWGQWHKFTDKQKESLKKYLMYLEKEDKKMETPRAEILHLNPDCQGSHYPPAEIEELQKRYEVLLGTLKIVRELFRDGSSTQQMIDEAIATAEGK